MAFTFCVALLSSSGKKDMNANGEVIFNIDPDASKNIKPGAFYNFALLVNAFNPSELTEYKKLTENGKVNIEYGAQDLALPAPEEPVSPFSEILAARLEQTDSVSDGVIKGAIVEMKLEDCADIN